MVSDGSGIAGQNTPDPASIFGRHVVVQIGNLLYDPSYGITYAYAEGNQLGDFEAKAVAGYQKERRIDGANRFIFKRIQDFAANTTGQRLNLANT